MAFRNSEKYSCHLKPFRDEFLCCHIKDVLWARCRNIARFEPPPFIIQYPLPIYTPSLKPLNYNNHRDCSRSLSVRYAQLTDTFFAIVGVYPSLVSHLFPNIVSVRTPRSTLQRFGWNRILHPVRNHTHLTLFHRMFYLRQFDFCPTIIPTTLIQYLDPFAKFLRS